MSNPGLAIHVGHSEWAKLETDLSLKDFFIGGKSLVKALPGGNGGAHDGADGFSGGGADGWAPGLDGDAVICGEFHWFIT